MKANENTMIVGDEIVLVPYRIEHVATYHEWMANPELRELTASEPLSEEDEYAMQKKWQVDDDKLTFIILAREPSDQTPGAELETASVEALPMIGDVNLFLKGSPEEEDFEVEVEIMIAEPAFRRRGCASAALQLIMSYATSPASPSPLPIPPERLVARIGEKNMPSIRLFEKLGFAITKYVQVFGEVEMRFVDNGTANWKSGEICNVRMHT